VSARGRPLARILAVALAILAGAACGGGREPAGAHASRRWIEIGPQDRAAFLPWPASWAFRASEDLAPWILRKGKANLAIGPDGLGVEIVEGSPILVREVEPTFGATRAVFVFVQRFEGRVEFFWAPPRGAFGVERRLVAEPVHDEAGAGAYARFDLGSHPLWTGNVARVGLRFVSPTPSRFTVREIRLLRHPLDPEGLAEFIARPWKVDFGGEVRTSILAPPGFPVSKAVRPGPATRFRGAYGIRAAVRRPIRFVISFRRARGGTEKLLEATLDPRDQEDVSRWHPFELDLARFDGKAGEIVLDTVAESRSGVPFGLPVWGAPEIVLGTRTPRRPDVVLVSLDTLRADHLSAYGYGRLTSPNLDAFAREAGVLFRSVVAPSPWTLPSHVSLFTGLDAVRHRQNFPVPVTGSLTMLAEILRASGYETVGVTGGGMLVPQFGLTQGFERYRYWRHDEDRAEEVAAGAARCLEILREARSRPLFLFFHTYEVHSPYYAREPWYGRFLGETGEDDGGIVLATEPLDRAVEDGYRDRARLVWRDRAEAENAEAVTRPFASNEGDRWIARYDSGIAHADAQLGLLFDALSRPPYAGRTLIVVTSDHGEALGEHDRIGHTTLYDVVLLVPLIIALPDRSGAGGVVESQTRLVDVTPTILDILGIRIPKGLTGESLLPLMRGRTPQSPRDAWSYAALSNEGVSLRLRNRLKYLVNDSVWEPIRGREELFHIDRDPGELHNAARGSRETGELNARALREIGAAHVGLRIVFSNDRSEPLRFRLAGPAVQPSMKSIDLPAGALEAAENGVNVLVSPGETFSICTLDMKAPVPIDIAMTARGTGGATVELEARSPDEPTSLPWACAFDGRNWHPGPVPAPVAAGITVVWDPHPEEHAETPPDDDEEGGLEAQLRALGYIR